MMYTNNTFILKNLDNTNAITSIHGFNSRISLTMVHTWFHSKTGATASLPKEEEQTENLKTKILTFVCLLSPNQAPFYTLHY